MFEDIQSVLSDNYPGVNKSIFMRELYMFLGVDIDKEQIVDSRMEAKIANFKKLVIQGVPFEYISGVAHFYGRDFVVGPNVLIPRQETEIIVECIVNMRRNLSESLDVLDMCTGSGCIGLSIACELGSQVSKLVLSDIAVEATNYSMINKEKFSYQIASNTEIFIQLSDLFRNIQGDYDLIISNPPYIKARGHLKNVHDQVQKFEPPSALFIDDEKYEDFFNKLFLGVVAHLRKGGIFIMEGHEDELSTLVENFKHANSSKFTFEVLKDLTGRDRFIKATKGA